MSTLVSRTEQDKPTFLVKRGDLSFEGETNCWNDYTYKIELSELDVDRIKQFQSLIVELNDDSVYELTYFDNPITVFEGDPDDEENLEEQRLDVVVVHVTRDELRITGVLKHDCATWDTGHFSLNDMEEE